MNADVPNEERERILVTLEHMEQRLARIEEFLEIGPAEEVVPAVSAAVPPRKREAEEFEFEIGETWFAKAGIGVFAAGIAFALTLPYPSLPAAVPGLLGFALSGLLFLLAHAGRTSFDLISHYLRGAGMALLCCSALRLFVFGHVPVFASDSAIGMLILAAVFALNLSIAVRRASPYLAAIALATGYASTAVFSDAALFLPALLILAACAAAVSVRFRWNGPLMLAAVLSWVRYFIWSINDPLLGHPPRFLDGAPAAPFVLLLSAVVFAAAAVRRSEENETQSFLVAALLNGGGCAVFFLLHTVMAFRSFAAEAHIVSSVVFIALAVVFRVRARSRYATFVYAMLGYSALSTALILASKVPDLFVWLSLESALVVVTAIWFRSRFIVVANFVIYIAVVIGYIATPHVETGISFGFGVVALFSARILNWRQDRLELKTDMMRNAYLACALVILPYALDHLLPAQYVAPSWVGLAIFYYAMNALIRNQKYRWMGHLTLMLTAVYVVVIGTSNLDASWRILSFLVLGAALLTVSIIFTRQIARKRQGASADGMKNDATG